MIGWLSGKLLQHSAHQIVVDTKGVGYEVTVTPHTLASLLGRSSGGHDIQLFIHTHVREDGITLYGFSTLLDRELFLLLTSVSGIGAKTAMGILSALPVDRLIAAIRTNDTPFLQRTPGIGKKTAERLVVELRDKIKDFSFPVDALAGPSRMGDPTVNDLISALMNLGYKRPQAEAAVGQVDLSKFNSFDTILRETLKVIAK